MLQKLHKYFRKPDDPRYTRLDTLADELEAAGVPRLVVILALYIVVAFATCAIVGAVFFTFDFLIGMGLIGKVIALIGAMALGAWLAWKRK